jgi:hypothetical protein
MIAILVFAASLRGRFSGVGGVLGIIRLTLLTGAVDR